MTKFLLRFFSVLFIITTVISSGNCSTGVEPVGSQAGARYIAAFKQPDREIEAGNSHFAYTSCTSNNYQKSHGHSLWLTSQVDISPVPRFGHYGIYRAGWSKNYLSWIYPSHHFW